MTQAALESFPVQLSRQRHDQLLSVFWCGAIAILLYEIYGVQTGSIWSQASAILITIVSLIPFYLWCSGRVLGMPVFPMFALTFVWTYAFPLISNHPVVITYTPQSHLFAAVTVAGTLLLGAWVWYRFVTAIPPQPSYYRALGVRKGDQFFLVALASSVVFNICNAAGWITITGPLFSIIRNSTLGLTAISTFVLCYRFGAQSLSRRQITLLIGLILSFVLTDALSFLLIGTASISMIAISAYTIGRKKVPIIAIAVFFALLTFLNYGKADMRGKYWFSDVQPNVVPWEYPALYREWIDYSWKFVQKREKKETEEDRSFTERASVIHMLLLAQNLSPEKLPYLNGATYAIIPQILVPRIFVENRIRSQEGTHMLSVHYGLQTEEATQVTSISWGLLAEAYGNFGLLGCAGLAIVLGAFYGKATQLSINAPLLSIRSLFTILLVTFAFQTEWTAGTYLAALAQASYLLLGIAIVFMENYRVPPSAIVAFLEASRLE
ncbi:hypothetical protein [Leptolyngbya sp. GGD]|uniref:hypothetical protein n=1 Tax=Leptolyngbya sp. GGD TaxID=2997907 RepID=UPI00227B0318|nr:hypothetical protein [Leptolyngbya sp. GGD]MCY6489319.1 hypothetical protein [Leptolyngbya sp. GGD]